MKEKRENLKPAVLFEAASYSAEVIDDAEQKKTVEMPISALPAELPKELTQEETSKMLRAWSGADKVVAATEILRKKTARVMPDSGFLQSGEFMVAEPALPGLPLQSVSGGLLSGQGVFLPEPQNRRKFLQETDREGGRLSAVQVYRFLVSRFVFRIYLEDFYRLEAQGTFQQMSDADVDRLINFYFGRRIEKEQNLSIYVEAREYMRKDYRLLVKEEAFLPLRYWAFADGLLDIRTGERLVNEGQFFIRNVLQCQYLPDADCPQFEQYVSAIAGGDASLIQLLWETVGYMLSRDTNGKVFFCCIGPKDTGKSLFAKVIAYIVGEKAVSYLSASDFAGRFDVGELLGKQLNVSMDLPDKALTAEAVGKIKALTGNDVIRSDVKYREAISFRPTARLLFGANAKIRTEVFDPAFVKRMIVLPFNYPVPKNRQDHELEAKLFAERAGICRKGLEAYLRLVSRGYHFTEIDWSNSDEETVDVATVIRLFASERCEITGCEADKIASAALYAAFENYCAENSVNSTDLNDFSKKFRLAFSEGVEKKKVKIDGKAVQGFTGIILKEK